MNVAPLDHHSASPQCCVPRHDAERSRSHRPLLGVACWIVLLICPNQGQAADAGSYDVVVYGGTSAAVATAVQARKMAKSVIIVCPDKHLGGLTSGGLGWTDSGKKDAIGGLSREFYHRVWRHYQQPEAWRWEDQGKFGNRNQSPPSKSGDGATMWVFEPHVAERIFDDWVKELEIPVRRDRWLDRSTEGSPPRCKGVQLRRGDGESPRIVSITMENGEVYRGGISHEDGSLTLQLGGVEMLIAVRGE